MRGNNNIIKWKQILCSQKNCITTSKTLNPLKGKPYLAKKKSTPTVKTQGIGSHEKETTQWPRRMFSIYHFGSNSKGSSYSTNPSHIKANKKKNPLKDFKRRLDWHQSIWPVWDSWWEVRVASSDEGWSHILYILILILIFKGGQ